MRKIYSLVLMAAALLVGTNVQAATITVPGNQATLELAFANANSGDEIQLQSNVTVYSTIEINGKNLTLDMNGFDAEMNTVPTDGMKKPWMFVIFKGSLEVKGQGQILNSIPQVWQYQGKKIDGGKWAGVKYTTDQNSTYADEAFVMANPAATTPTATYSEFKWVPKYSNIAYDKNGYMTAGSEIITFKLLGSVNASDANFTKLTIGEDVEVVADPGKAGVNIDGWASVGETKCGTAYPGMTYAIGMAYGVVVDIFGKVNGQKYGVQISGNLSKMDKNNKTNWPQVNIKPGSEVWSQPEENESIGFYAAGQGNSMVEGTVHASTGVYVKGGTVEIHDAYVHSDNSNYSEPEAKGSGVDACGSAVVVDSKSGYAGAQEVKISGDTKLEGAGGYAIEEVITETKDGGTMVQAVTIEGGVIEGGDKGALTFTEKTATEGEKVIVSDGTFTGTTTVGGSTEDNPSSLFPKDEVKHVTIVDGKMVVSDGAAPVPATADINELTESTDIQYNDERNMTLTKDLTFKVVELIGAETLNIPEGKTLKADKLILGADANVTIAVGGVLIITGKAGIVSDKPENLVVKASADGMGSLVFNPENQTNRSPWATVEYYATAHKRPNGSHTFDIFAFPFVKGTISKPTNSMTQGTNWKHIVDGNWVNFASTDAFAAEAEPFESIALACQAEEVGNIYTFKGQLQGNISGKFEMKKGFNYIGNGFLGAMNAKVILNQLENQSVKTILYTWNGNGYDQENAASIQKMNDDQIKEYLTAMKMFVIYANEDIPALDLNYRSLVYENYVPANK